MAQLPCIGLYKPYINLIFGDCAMYFDHSVLYNRFFGPNNCIPRGSLSHIGSSRGLAWRKFGMGQVIIRCKAPFDLSFMAGQPTPM